MIKPIKLINLSAKEYSHPLDLEARATLEKAPGLSFLVKKVYEIGIDRMLHLESMANKVRVSEQQFPDLYKLFKETCQTLDINNHVDLYINQSFSLNAYAAGLEYPHITVTTELLNHFEDDELRFVFGHELGHIQSEHILYHQIGYFLPTILKIIGTATLGIGQLVGTGLEIALYDWIRKSEFTADRAGLLACQNPDIFKRAFCKLTGIPQKWYDHVNMDEIHRQADDFEKLSLSNNANKFYSYFGQMWNTHPWMILRYRDLYDWFEGLFYSQILTRREKLIDYCSRTCRCGQVIPEDSLYCIYCGRKVEA